LQNSGDGEMQQKKKKEKGKSRLPCQRRCLADV